MTSFYAVANGKQKGIFLNWNECKESVNGFKNAIYKKFNTQKEAEYFIVSYNNNKIKEETNEKQIENDIFVPDYYIYTDGACSNNGRHNATAGIGIFFGINDSRNVSEKIEGKQTNNTAELSAIIKAYSIIESDITNGKKIAILTDSEYSIKCVSSYGEKCYNENWKKDIPNKELVKIAYENYKDKKNVKFIYIKAHTDNTDIHSLGNYHADKLANNAIGLDICPYNE